MIDHTHPLPVVRQCQLLKLAHSTASYQPTPVSEITLALMRRIDALHLQYPFAGAHRLRDLLRQEGRAIGRRQVATLMRRGFVYLFAVLDWASRRVLAWRLSNTLTTDFCLDAVQEAVVRYGTPEIFYTDQGCQFTSHEFTGLLAQQGIQISMDGKGCWRDNVFVERLWKSIRYEEVYLHAYEIIGAAHQALDGQTPDQVYSDHLTTRLTAALSATRQAPLTKGLTLSNQPEPPLIEVTLRK